jgi:BioD-like phosphotransacetylase family protein
LAKASERGIPLLLVPGDTYATAKQIDDMQPLLTADDADRIALLAQLAQTHINLEEIIPA